MFRALLCSSSGSQQGTIQNLVIITLCRWPSDDLMMMSTIVLETCRGMSKLIIKQDFLGIKLLGPELFS